MSLDLQIKTIVSSFFFGIYFSFIILLNYRLTNKLKKRYNIIITFFVIFFNTLLYFLILLDINNGIIHPYGLLAMLSGCLLEQYFEHLIEKIHKKWYTFIDDRGDKMAQKKVSKKAKRRLAVMGPIVIFIIGYCLFTLVTTTINLYNLHKEEKELSSTLVELKRQAKILNAEIDKLKDPEYIAAYARENFSYSKPGEKIIKLNNQEKEKEEEKFELNIDYNYMIYGGIGILLIIFIYIIKKEK